MNKLKELKRQFLKYIQSKLLNFVKTEYRTEEEIQKDRMDSYVNFFNQNPNWKKLFSDNQSSFVGEIKYVTVELPRC